MHIPRLVATVLLLAFGVLATPTGVEGQEPEPKKEPEKPVAVLPSDLLLREDQPWGKPDVTAAALVPLLAEAEKWLAEASAEKVPEGQQPPLKAPLEQMMASLKELASLLERQAAVAKPPEDLEARLKRAQTELDRLVKGPPPTLVEGSLDTKSIEAAVAVVTNLRAEETKAQETLKRLEDRLAAGPDEQKKATQRLTEARAAATALQAVPADLTGTAKLASQLRSQNTRLAVRTAEKLGEVLAAEVKLAQTMIPLRRAEHELARKRVEVHAAVLEKLQAELKDELERRRQSLEYQVQTARQAYEEAKKAGEPFLILRTLQDLWLAGQRQKTHANEEDLNRVRGQLQKERDFLKNEQTTFDNLRRIIEKGGRRGQLVAERLHPMYQRVQKDIRKRKSDGVEPISRRLAELQLDRAELSMLDPGAELSREFDPAAFSLRPYRLQRLQDDLAGHQRERTKVIGERLTLLNNLAQEYTELEGVMLEIDEHLRSKHDFILQRLFWIQEDAPLTWEVARQGLEQLRTLEGNLRRSLAQETPLENWLRGLRGTWSGYLLLAGVVLMPVAIFAARKRLDRIIRVAPGAAPAVEGGVAGPGPESPERPGTGAPPLPAPSGGADPSPPAGTTDSTAPAAGGPEKAAAPTGPSPHPAHGNLAVLSAGLVSALLWPGYWLLLAYLVGGGASSTTMAAAFSESLIVVAASIGLYTFGRAAFAPSGILIGHFGQPERPGIGFYRLLRFSGWLSLFLLTPAMLFRHVAVGAPATGRIFYTLYEFLMAMLLTLKMRRDGPIVPYLFGPATPDARPGLAWRWWRSAHLLGALALFGIVAMDALGYRYGARVISYNVLKSVATVLVFVLLYNVLMSVARQRAAILRLVRNGAGGDDASLTPEARGAAAENYGKFLRLVLGLTGALALAYYWGLGSQVLKSLDNIVLFAVNAEANVFLTLGDVLLGMLTILVTWAVLANLDGVYEVVLYPYFEWDAGLRYAMLTLSRYGLFFAGFAVTLALMHVNLSSIQWMLAAASVGIGFGLQEIIANFICGIILLLERPIRVGDIVTIGETAGIVKKINIRATTVENWNSESMIIPNREFIVGKVINWTHSDKVTRLALNIGVAYGTDLDRAKAIMLRAVEQHPLVPKLPAPAVRLVKFGDSSVDFVVFVYATEPAHRLTIQEEILGRVYRDFAAAGIQIPFPQRDLYLRGLPDELAKWLGRDRRETDSPAPTLVAPPPAPALEDPEPEPPVPAVAGLDVAPTDAPPSPPPAGGPQKPADAPDPHEEGRGARGRKRERSPRR